MKEILPKIVAVVLCNDHGSCDGGATATCPHCGADGRYIYNFICEDGSRRGAMKGCIKLFPRSIAADECEKSLAKQNAAKNGTAYLSKWDNRMLEALSHFTQGLIPLAKFAFGGIAEVGGTFLCNLDGYKIHKIRTEDCRCFGDREQGHNGLWIFEKD